MSDEPTEKADPISASSPTEDDEKLVDLARQTGDMTVYKYWFAHIGWNSAAIYFSFLLLRTFCASFPRVCITI